MYIEIAMRHCDGNSPCILEISAGRSRSLLLIRRRPLELHSGHRATVDASNCWKFLVAAFEHGKMVPPLLPASNLRHRLNSIHYSYVSSMKTYGLYMCACISLPFCYYPRFDSRYIYFGKIFNFIRFTQ